MSLRSASNSSVACVGKTFILNCSHPPLDVKSTTGDYIFRTSLPTWKINGEILTLDGSLFTASYPSYSNSFLEVAFDKFPFFSLNQVFNFTCSVQLKNLTVLNSKAVSVSATGKNFVVVLKVMHSIIHGMFILHLSTMTMQVVGD